MRRRLASLTDSLKGYAAIWRIGACRSFLIAQFVSQLGTSAYRVAIAWFAVSTLQRPSQLAWILAVGALPQMLLGPLAGALGDRFGRKRTVVGSDMVACAAYLAMFLLAEAGALKLPEILGLSVAAGIASAASIPNSSALIPSITDSTRISETNAARLLTSQGASILGPAVAGAVIPLAGVAAVFLANSLSFLASAVVLGRARLADAPQKGHTDTSRRRLTNSGWPLVVRSPWLRTGILVGAAANLLLVAPMAVFVPALVGKNQLGAQTLAAYAAAQAAGLVIGAVSSPLLTAKRSASTRIAFISVALGAGCMLPVTYATNSYVVTAAGFAVGLAIAVYEVQWESSLQQQVQLRMLGTACAADAWASFAGRTIGLSIAGWILRIEDGAHGLRWTTLIFIIVMIVPILGHRHGSNGENPFEIEDATTSRTRVGRMLGAEKTSHA